MADPGKLRQILLNLCKNAVEAMPKGGTLTLESYTSEKWVCLDVSDTGEGIPETMPIFEPAATNKPQGTGFGLLIVREIIQQHKGRISYTTERGKGTTFHLSFPVGYSSPGFIHEIASKE
jgi:signal transduction histidine kinase